MIDRWAHSEPNAALLPTNFSSLLKRVLEVQGKPKRDVKFRVREKRVPAQSSFRMEQINQDDLESPLDDGVYADQETYKSHFAENDEAKPEAEGQGQEL